MSTCATCARKSTNLFLSSSFTPCVGWAIVSERRSRNAKLQSNESSVTAVPPGRVVHTAAECDLCSCRHGHLLRPAAIPALERERLAETSIERGRADPDACTCGRIGQRDRPGNRDAIGAGSQQ